MNELSLIKLTTIINFGFGCAGIVFAFFSDSKSVLFDGLYSFTASFFTLISAKVVKLIISGDDRDYQFGYGAFEPFFIIIRTVFILIMDAFLIFAAVQTIISGGNMIRISVASAYTVLSVVTCGIISVILRRASRRSASPVLAAESKSWLNDTLLSTAVLAAFGLILVLEKTPLAFIVPYIDPGMTLVFVGFMIPSLIGQFFSNLRELLTAAPPMEVQDGLDAVIEPYIKSYDFFDFQTYSTKRGRNLYIVIHVYMKKEVPIRTLDYIRKRMISDIRKFWHYSDIDIVFTLNRDWISMSAPGPEETPSQNDSRTAEDGGGTDR